MDGFLKLMLASTSYDFIGWALLHSMWQLTAVGLVYWVVAAMLRKRSPQTIYILGCATLVAMFIVPLATGVYCIDFSQVSATDFTPTVQIAVENVAQTNTSLTDANPIALPPVAVDAATGSSVEKASAPMTIAVGERKRF